MLASVSAACEADYSPNIIFFKPAMATLGYDSVYIFNEVEDADLDDLQDFAEEKGARSNGNREIESTKKPPVLIQRNIDPGAAGLSTRVEPSYPIDPDAVPLASSSVLSEEMLKQVEITETISTDGNRSLDLTIQDNVIGSTIAIEPGAEASFVGRKIKQSKITATSSADNPTTLSIAPKVVKDSRIVVDGEESAVLNIEAGKIKASKIKFINDNSADSVSFNQGVLINSSRINLGEGDDTISFDGTRIKGKNVIKLGEGDDTLAITGKTEIAGKGQKRGRLVVKDLENGDSIDYGGQSFNGAEIKATGTDDLPAFLVIKGLS